MYGVPPMNFNSISIPTKQIGCCKNQFDSTYPVQLNGIISPVEFQQSIDQINHSIPSRKPLAICGAIFLALVITALVLFIVGGVTAAKSESFGFPPLIGVAIGLSLFSMIGFTVSICIVYRKASARLYETVAAESAKYSRRSPVACSWRLFTTRIYTGAHHDHQNSYSTYHLVIDIAYTSPTYFRPTPPQNLIYSNLDYGKV